MNTSIASILAHKTPNIYSVAASDCVDEAVRIMNRFNVGSVVVLDMGKMIGLFTERELMARVVASGRQPTLTCICDVMTRNPVTISPEMSIGEALALFSKIRCRHLPVVHPYNGLLLGILTMGDLTRWMNESNVMSADSVNHMAGVAA